VRVETAVIKLAFNKPMVWYTMYRSFASDEGIFSAQLDHSIVSLADFRIPHHYTVSGVTSSTSSERCGSLDVFILKPNTLMSQNG